MRPEGTFVAERLAAQHCAELLSAPRQAANPLAELAQFGERLAAALGHQLGTLCPGVKMHAEAGEPLELQANTAHDRRAEPVLNSTVSVGAKDATLFASLPQSTVLCLVDLALGGTGKDCAPLGKLPMSAQLMFTRFEKVFAAALAEALEMPGADAISFRNQSAAPNANAPFAGCKRTILPIRIALADAEPCELVLTFPGASVASLFAERAAPSEAAPRAKAQPTSEPFAGIPLSLKAILVDMPMSVSILARLQPGMVIPVTVARSVPLVAGDQIVAHGTVGAMDDFTALQLTRITEIKEK